MSNVDRSYGNGGSLGRGSITGAAAKYGTSHPLPGTSGGLTGSNNNNRAKQKINQNHGVSRHRSGIPNSYNAYPRGLKKDSSTKNIVQPGSLQQSYLNQLTDNT